VVGDDLYHDEDEFPPLPADLAAAIDELLSEFDDEASLEAAAVRELLWTVLERVGRLDEYRISETMGGWTVEDARDEEHRRQLIEEERRFVSHCARELDEIAAAAIKFALALWIQCSGEWEDLPKQIDDARAEVVSELQISVAHPGRRFPLEATKRDVEASLSGTLWRVAAEVATSAHELATSRLRGAAGTTMLGSVAAVIFEAYEIRQAIARQPVGER